MSGLRIEGPAKLAATRMSIQFGGRLAFQVSTPPFIKEEVTTIPVTTAKEMGEQRSFVGCLGV